MKISFQRIQLYFPNPLSQNVMISITGGKMRASVELLTAPTSEITAPKLGIIAASATVGQNIHIWYQSLEDIHSIQASSRYYINHKTNRITKVYRTNFLGLTLHSTLSWKPHIDQLIPKLNSACYVIRSLKSIFFLGNLRMIYFSTVHSIISYSIIFWGNSTYSNIIFKIQKRVIGIMMNVGNKCNRTVTDIREFMKV